MVCDWRFVLAMRDLNEATRRLECFLKKTQPGRQPQRLHLLVAAELLWEPRALPSSLLAEDWKTLQPTTKGNGWQPKRQEDKPSVGKRVFLKLTSASWSHGNVQREHVVFLPEHGLISDMAAT